MVDDPCADGVVQDVVDGVAEVALGVDDPRREACAEEVAGALVPQVEAERVRAVEPLDAGGELRLRRVEDEMDVVVHEAEGVAVPPVAVDGRSEAPEIAEPVVVVADDRGAVDPTRGHVEITVGESRTEHARHPVDGRRGGISRRRARTNRHAFVTLSSRFHRPIGTLSQGLTLVFAPRQRPAPQLPRRATMLQTRRGSGTKSISRSPAMSVP